MRNVPQNHIFSSKVVNFQTRSEGVSGRVGSKFHPFSSKIVNLKIRSAPQVRQFSSRIAYFQKRNFVKRGQFSKKVWGWPCRVGSVGSLLFRTHSQQRARASRGQSQIIYEIQNLECTNNISRRDGNDTLYFRIFFSDTHYRREKVGCPYACLSVACLSDRACLSVCRAGRSAYGQTVKRRDGSGRTTVNRWGLTKWESKVLS